MSEAGQAQENGAAGGARSGWRSWFASTGQPPAWPLVRYAAAGLFVGVAFGAALPQFRGTVLAALAGLISSAAV